MKGRMGEECKDRTDGRKKGMGGIWAKNLMEGRLEKEITVKKNRRRT